MRPTPLGLKTIAFFAVVLISFFVSPYTNLFFLLIAFLSVLLILNVVWTVTNMRGLSGRVLDVEPCPAGGRLQVVVELRPTRNRIHFDVGAHLVSTTGHHAIGRAMATPRLGPSRITGLVDLPTRGVHRVTGAFIESSYPLGLVRLRIAVKAPSEIVVFPAPLQLGSGPQSATPSEAAARILYESRIGTSDDRSPSGLREFRAGDPLSHVHWRASARRLELVVKEFEADGGDPGLEIVLDRRCAAEEFEHSLSVLSTFALRTLENKEALVIKSQGMHRTFGGDGHEPICDLLRWLAEAERLPASAPPPPHGVGGALRLPLATAADRAALQVEP